MNSSQDKIKPAENISDKSILITGASRGIGKAIALKLASLGYNLVLHYHQNQDKAQDTESACKLINPQIKTRLIKFNIANRQDCKQALEEDIDANEAYYGVICNAGIAADNSFPSMTDHEWDSVLNTNLDGFYNVLQPIIMPMVRAKQGGRIITMSSAAGIAGNRGQVNYSAAKAGIIGATKALALELAKRQITVNCIAPGLIDTEMSLEAPIEEIMKLIPLKRMGKPEEIAGLAAFLLSDEAAYITRQVISVNGGLI